MESSPVTPKDVKDAANAFVAGGAEDLARAVRDGEQNVQFVEEIGEKLFPGSTARIAEERRKRNSPVGRLKRTLGNVLHK